MRPHFQAHSTEMLSVRAPKLVKCSSCGLIRPRMGRGWRTDIFALPGRINLHLPHPEQWHGAMHIIKKHG